MGFEFGEKVPHYWLDNSYILSHTMNALSVLFPQGEQFFVDSVRYYQDQINDPKLKKEVRGFIGQEAMHSLEHKSMNQHVRDQGMPVEELEEHLEVVLGIAKKLPKRHQLAITCALEHMTAMMADMLLERSDVREDMHETMRPLWVWHAIEETEHKAVTYDVFNQVGGTYAERTFYLAFSTAALGVMASYFTTRMMLNDPKNFSLKDSARGLWRMWGKNGTFSSLIPTWLEYFKPGFHPWDHDNSELIARFKEQINEYIAPQYQKGNRRTIQ
jgi:predicted metal-dependent hydrolase